MSESCARCGAPMDAGEAICPKCGYDPTLAQSGTRAKPSLGSGTDQPPGGRSAARLYFAGIVLGAGAGGLLTLLAFVIGGAVQGGSLPGVPAKSWVGGALMGGILGAVFCFPAALVGALIGACIVALGSTRSRPKSNESRAESGAVAGRPRDYGSGSSTAPPA
jgi:hypothetical protein